MALCVTFDTNALDLACRPERSPNDPRQSQMQKVHDALANGQIEGFYSVTMLTIEGIMRRDRVAVFAGTRTVMQPEARQITRNADLSDAIRETVGSEDLETIVMEHRVEQPDRTPLHSEVIARMKAAKDMGFKVLKGVPRIGAFHITDPTEEYFLKQGEGAELTAWIDKAIEVAGAIEARGIGFAQVKRLGKDMATSDPASIWFRSLDQATDVHQKGAVKRAFSEWADGDSVAVHVAYGLDIFCSNDEGKSNAADSVLDSTHRGWLAETYGVRFMTFEDLAANLP